jgi:hypothetical protein
MYDPAQRVRGAQPLGEDAGQFALVLAVGIRVPLLFGCAPSAELFQHIALRADDYIFGHLSAFEAEAASTYTCPIDC